MLILGASVGFAVKSSAQFLLEDFPLEPGEKLVIDFRFSSLATGPEGDADVLLVSAGSSSRDFGYAVINLYGDGVLLSAEGRSQANLSSRFVTPASVYTFSEVVVEDLIGLLDGTITGTYEVIPEFMGVYSDPIIRYGGAQPIRAARATSSNTLVEYEPAEITNVQVMPHGGSCTALLQECEADLAACIDATPDCSDGIDNDGDNRIDFPDDDGCDGPADATETAPARPPPCGLGPEVAALMAPLWWLRRRRGAPRS
jgi:hypothetical protein